MIKKLILIILFLFSACPSWAMKTPVMSICDNSLSNTTTQYAEPNYGLVSTGNIGGGLGWDFETNAEQIVAVDSTLTELNVKLRAAPGVGKQYVFTFRVAGSDTAAVVTISGAATSGSWTGSVSITAGQKVSLKVVPTGTPDVTKAAWSLILSAGANQAPILGSLRITDSASTTYMGYFGTCRNSTTEISRQVIISTPGTFSKFYVDSVAPGVGKSFTFTFRKNGVDQALVVVLSGTNTSASDLVNSFSVVAGDIVSVKMVPSGTPTTESLAFGVLFSPTTDGESPISFGSSDDPSNSVVEYGAISSSASTGSWTAIEADRQHLGIGCILKDLYVNLQNDPSVATSSFTIALRVGGATSALSTTISVGATTGNNTSDDITITSSDLINIICTPANLPTSGNVYYGMTAYIAPTERRRAGRLVGV